MYYELYMDVFFLVNFMMDVCVLIVSKNILKCPATYGSICLGALTGAGMTCVMVLLPVPYRVVKFAIYHGLISILMTKTGLRVRWGRSFLKAYIVVYVSAFLIGGIFFSLKQYMREMSMFFVFAIISSFIAHSAWKFILYIGRCRSESCMVLLCQNGNQLIVKAILDTGNRLRDMDTGKPVSIISKEVAKKLWQDVPVENLRYIPYHTIGKKEGVLPMLILDRMCLYLEEEIWVSEGLVAISEEEISSGEFEMILNPFVR